MQDNTNSVVKAIVAAIQDKKGTDIVIADFRKLEDTVCKYFIICQGNTRPQVEAIAHHVRELTLEVTGEKPYAIAGEQVAQWIAMDYGDILVHIFQPQARAFYDLEHLWADACIERIPDIDNQEPTDIQSL